VTLALLWTEYKAEHLDDRTAGRLDDWTAGRLSVSQFVDRYRRFEKKHLRSIDEVQEAATRWLWTYNNERPNIALGGSTPMQKLAMAA
jgi:putative transposase